MQKRTIRAIANMIVFCVTFVVLLSAYFSFPAVIHACELSDDLFSVCFTDEQSGWACGRWGTVVHTQDGGKTWQPLNSGTDYTLSSISFVDRNTGWAVGDGGTIIHTIDGGTTWEKQQSPVKYFLMGGCFVNHKKGWIAGERTHILFTEDGGRTWTVQFSDEDFILKSISFCDDKNGWAVGEFGYTYHTVDGGKTWEQQAGEFGLSEESGEIYGGNFLFDVVAVGPSRAWVSGIDGYIAQTSDGGATWQRAVKDMSRSHLFGITSDTTGKVIVGGTAILGTVQKKSFQAAQLEPSIKYSWIYDISPRGPAGFVAVGSEGLIYVSDSQAASWKQAMGKKNSQL